MPVGLLASWFPSLSHSLFCCSLSCDADDAKLSLRLLQSLKASVMKEEHRRTPRGSDRQPAFYPEPMSSPTHATQGQLESGMGWQCHHLEPFPNLDTPSTGKSEVVMQPLTHFGIIGECGLRGSPYPTRGLRTRVHSAGVNDGSVGLVGSSSLHLY